MRTNKQLRTPARAWLTLALWLAVTVIAATLPYLSSLDGEFVLDDTGLIVDNPMVHSLSNLPKAFSSHYLIAWANTESLYYRPLSTVSFQINYALAGADPPAFRLTNLLLHALAAVLVVLIALRLTRSMPAAGLSGVAFGVLASHAESVAWISGRTDLLATVFALGSVLAFLANRDLRPGFSWPLAAACSVLALCAMLSKESTIIVPALLVVCAWACGDRPRRDEVLKWLAALGPAVVVYLLMRDEVLGSATPAIDQGYLLKERLLRLGFVYATYARMLVFPQDARFFYGHVTENMRFSPLDLALWVVPIGLAVTAVWARRRAPIVAFGTAWALVSLAPAADLIHSNTLLPADRFIYLPSAGTSILLGWLVWRGWERYREDRPLLRWSIALAAAAWVLVSASFALTNSAYYESELAWAKRVTETDPPHRSFRLLAAEFYEQAGDATAALHEYGAAAELLSDQLPVAERAAISYRLGVALARLGDMRGAAKAFGRSALLAPEMPEAWRDLGRAKLRLGDYSGAISAFLRAMPLAKPDLRDFLELGQAYKGAGQNDKAMAQFRRIVRSSPNSEVARRARLEIESMPEAGSRQSSTPNL